MNVCSGSVLHILYLSSTCGPPATVRLLLRTQSRTLPLAVTNAPGPPESIWTPCGRSGLVRRYALREPTSQLRTLRTHNNYSLATVTMEHSYIPPRLLLRISANPTQSTSAFPVQRASGRLHLQSRPPENVRLPLCTQSRPLRFAATPASEAQRIPTTCAGDGC